MADVAHTAPALEVLSVDRWPALTEKVTYRLNMARVAGGVVATNIRKAGEALLEAKAAIPRGAWLPWLREHCRLEESNAQFYMRVAAGWDEKIAKPDHDPVSLTVRDLRCIFAKPRQEPRRPAVKVYRIALDTTSPEDIVVALSGLRGRQSVVTVRAAAAPPPDDPRQLRLFE
jgi:hypothetical protein